MNKYLACLALLSVALCGCMHTVLGGHSESPDKRYYLWLKSNGASGEAYTAKTKKRIWISIADAKGGDSKLLFQRKYVLTGSDIEWTIRWPSEETVSLEFYDWGDGVFNYNNSNPLARSNHIVSFLFTLDRTTHKFVERK